MWTKPIVLNKYMCLFVHDCIFMFASILVCIPIIKRNEIECKHVCDEYTRRYRDKLLGGVHDLFD